MFQDNMTLKCQGITKLVYLQMLGYDMSWSNFNTIEVSCTNANSGAFPAPCLQYSVWPRINMIL